MPSLAGSKPLIASWFRPRQCNNAARCRIMSGERSAHGSDGRQTLANPENPGQRRRSGEHSPITSPLEAAHSVRNPVEPIVFPRRLHRPMRKDFPHSVLLVAAARRCFSSPPLRNRVRASHRVFHDAIECQARCSIAPQIYALARICEKFLTGSGGP